MTDKQPRALRLTDELTSTPFESTRWEAAAELRRLYQDSLYWQEKCNAYIEIHDAVVKDNERLHEVNAKLVEALNGVVDYTEWHNESGYDAHQKALAVLRKAQGDNNE